MYKIFADIFVERPIEFTFAFYAINLLRVGVKIVQ
jgi:hypothetical protein